MGSVKSSLISRQHLYQDKMQAKLMIFSFTLLFILHPLVDCRPQRSWLSQQCVQPGSCLHGSLGPCGGECRKGPGEICGGSGRQYGVCGEGLTCSDCNRCTGCSYTSFKCYSEEACVSSTDFWL